MKLVFDFGGVVFRWQPEQLLMREMPQVATDAAAAQAWVPRFFQGYQGDWADYDRGTVTAEELVRRIAARTGLVAADVARVVAGVAGELQPLPAMVDWLRRLHGDGRTLYYLSNMPAPVADHLQASHGLFGFFADGVFSARVRLIKPEPAIYALAAQRFGVAPDRLVFLDDHAPNVDAARAAGWHALHFVDAAQAEGELRDRGWA